MRTVQRNIGALLIAVVASTVAAVVPVSASRTSAVDGDRPLEVCRDSEGNTKTGALDVLLLLDNSKSLNSTRNGRIPSDPKNERYGAISEMLKTLGEVSGIEDDEEGGRKGENTGRKGVDINFGVIAFGDNARTALELEPLTSGNSQEIGKRVEEKVPGKVESQSSATNYITALESAVRILNSRPDENCKFLVWFTDGQFESRETKKSDEQREQAEWLQSKVCGKGGFADQFIQARINTFVLVLKPTKTDRRLAVSYGTMQAITGATDLPPEVQSGIGKSAGMCGGLESSPRLGDVLIASDAKEIARKIPTIANLLTNWVPVTQCPARSGSEGLAAMPAARHIKGLSFTAYEKGHELADLVPSEVIDNSGNSHPFTDYFEKDSGSRFEQKYLMNEKAEGELNHGWSINIKNGPSGWCVQMLEHKFEVAFKGNPAEPVVTSRGGSLTREDLDDLTYFDKSQRGGAITLTEAVGFTGEVGASLVIDPTKVIYANPIEIRVKQQDVPYLSCDSVVLKSVADIPSPARISALCDIDTEQTRLKDVAVTVIPDPLLKDEKCDAIVGLVQKPQDEDLGKKDKISGEIVHPHGTGRFYVVLEAQGNSANCVSEKSIVKVSWEVPGKGEQVLERPIKINVVWKTKPPIWLVWVIVLVALLIVALLNLVLLREIKKYTSKMAKSGLFAFEVPVTLTKMGSGQVIARTRDGLDTASVAFAVSEQIAVRIDGDRRHAKLMDGTRSTLRVKLPSLFRPFAAPLLILDSKKSVYYAPNFENGSGLAPSTRQATIVHSPSSNGNTCDAIVTLLIPNAGIGRDQLVRDLLGTKLSNAIKPTVSDPDWFREAAAQSNGSPTAADGGVTPPGQFPSNPPFNGGGPIPPRPGSN